MITVLYLCYFYNCIIDYKTRNGKFEVDIHSPSNPFMYATV